MKQHTFRSIAAALWLIFLSACAFAQTSPGTSTSDQTATPSRPKTPRTLEELRRTLESYKKEVFQPYSAALRENSQLQGNVVFKLKIAPTGEVTECEVVSSTLQAPPLEAELLSRVRLFQFGPKDAEPLVLTWPVSFVPR